MGSLFTSVKVNAEPAYEATIFYFFSCIDNTIGNIINKKTNKQPLSIVIDVFNFIFYELIYYIL